MRLASLAIRRFKGISDLTLVIPKTDVDRPGLADFLSLVGENNTSKSSVLEALRLALLGTGVADLAGAL
jgi:predicted ATP-dependent endonuclease of OLD family